MHRGPREVLHFEGGSAGPKRENGERGDERNRAARGMMLGRDGEEDRRRGMERPCGRGWRRRGRGRACPCRRRGMR